MIPDQKAMGLVQTVKKNGYLAIADFFKNGNYDDCLPRFIVRTFESFPHLVVLMDHVHLLERRIWLVILPWTLFGTMI